MKRTTKNYVKERTLRILCREISYQLYRLILKLTRGAKK